MKKIKLALTTMLTVVLLAGVTSVFAYNGTDVDTNYQITMPAVLTSGKGTVTTSKSGSFKYQFVETTGSNYNELKKLAARVELIRAYVAQSYANYEDAVANANYAAMVKQYEKTYNEKVADVYSTYGSFDSNTLSIVRSNWIKKLPNYTSNWTNSDSKQVALDLSTFTGTKYYVAWVKIGDMYDAEAYIVKGTKTDAPADDNTTPSDDNTTPADNNTTPSDDNTTPADNNTTPSDDNTTPSDDNNTTPEDNTKNDEKTPADNTNKKDGTSSQKDTTTKTGDKTVTTAKKLPHTGIVENIIIYAGIASAIVAAIVSFKKYKNIK